MYNIFISKKTETIKAVFKGHEEGFRFCDSDWGEIFHLLLKLQRNPNITGYNFKYYTE